MFGRWQKKNSNCRLFFRHSSLQWSTKFQVRYHISISLNKARYKPNQSWTVSSTFIIIFIYGLNKNSIKQKWSKWSLIWLLDYVTRLSIVIKIHTMDFLLTIILLNCFYSLWQKCLNDEKSYQEMSWWWAELWRKEGLMLSCWFCKRQNK